MKKKSQDYSQYFTGETPEYRPGGSVDFSQLSSMFSRTPETMNLVYQYAPDISQDVSYIFDFSNAGAYGVYIPALVEEMKTKELQNQLEQKGYRIEQEDGMLVAYPKEEKKEDSQVQAEIKQIWDVITAGKSEVLGVNMNKVSGACEQTMNQIVANAQNAGVDIPNTQLLWDMLVMMELGATIVHEWEHSRGGDEGASESREKDFVAHITPIIKQKYQAECGEEMPIGDMSAVQPPQEEMAVAKSKNWYKVAQYTNYVPQASKPTGSDLKGRHGEKKDTDSVLSDWSMIAQQDQATPIEKRLNRSMMSMLAPEIDQANNTIEEQLRKQTMADEVPNTNLIYEELLSKDRDDTQGYKTIQQLMEERRPQPLLLPLGKTASLRKQATLFGWYNNLEISDGSTIPGLGDRVMAWDDRDESFSGTEDDIKRQPRYNPTYDLKGMYYRYIEPRFKPQLWDDMTRDYGNTHPAKRFAQVERDIDTDLPEILKVLETVKDRILAGNMKASRLVVTGDIYPFIKRVVDCDGVSVKHFRFGRTDDGEFIFAVWIFDPSVSVDSVRKAETKFQNVDAPDDLDDLIEELLGYSSYRSRIVEEIVNTARQVCQGTEINDLYIVGMYAREIALGNEAPDVEQLDFTTNSPRMNSQIGQLLANMLGVLPDIDRDMTFVYKGIKVEFSISNRKEELAQLNVLRIRKKDQISIDLLKRDFTMNMFAYNVTEGVLIDPLMVAKRSVEEGVIRTYLNPEKIVKNNPMVVLRALKLKLQYNMEIDKDLAVAMIAYSDRLFKGHFTEFELMFARESIRSEGREEADKLFDAFGLWKLKNLK